MKAFITKDVLLKLLTPTQSLIEKRSVIPILSKVLLKTTKKNLQAFVTDQENSLQATASIQGEEGSVCVDLKTLFEITKELPFEEIQIEKPARKEGLSIKTSSSVFNIVGVSPEDFPVFPEMKNPKFFDFDSSALSSIIEQTLYCVSMDETRYHLTGVFCEKKSDSLHFVATDGYRLSFSELSNMKHFSLPEEGVIIPKKGLSEIQKLISGEEEKTVQVAIAPPQMLVRYGNFLLSIRLIEGKYPQYQKFIPKKSQIKAIVNKEILVQALRRVSVVSSQQSKNVLFSWKKKHLVLTASHPDYGDAEEKVPLIENNKEISIRFSARYVLEALNHTQGEDVTWEMTNATSSGLIRSKNSKSLSIIMPMKL